MTTKTKNIVLAHDSFTQLGGAERVFEQIVKLFPSSVIYTLVVDKKLSEYVGRFAHLSVSPLQYVYGLFPRFKYYLGVLPWIISHSNTNQADIILSSTSLFLKGLRKKKGAIHIQYCHTPPRFLWTDEAYVQAEVPLVLRPFASIFLRWLKKWDRRKSAQVDVFIANSYEVQSRIQKYYNRESRVIQPFVDTDFWKPTIAKQGYFLLAGRLVSHKKYELVIEAFNQLGFPLKVAGRGRLEKYLRKNAKGNIVFLGRVTDDELRDLYSGAEAFLYPQVEDFGIMPLEAAACGTPTIAAPIAGSLETVAPDLSGVYTHPTVSVESIMAAVQDIHARQFDQKAMREFAERFSIPVFNQKILEVVETYANTR